MFWSITGQMKKEEDQRVLDDLRRLAGLTWETVERPGYFGKKRDELYKKWNHEYGEGDWRIAWQWGSQTILRPEALQVYEDAYYEFFGSHPETLKWLITNASNVYDTAKSNIEAEFSYDQQETPNNHIHDVAIRRAVLRRGVWFEGDHLMHVRGEGTEGDRLSPHKVPFHRVALILNGDVKDYGGKGTWWRTLGIPFSVEEFYQMNKVLQRRVK